MPCTVYIRLPHHTAFFNSHSIFSIFMYIMLFQTYVMLSVWTELHIPSSLKSVERLNSQKLWSLAWISTSSARVRSRTFLRRRAIAKRKAPTEQHCTQVEEMFWVRIDGSSSQHYENYFPFASSLFTMTVSVPKPRTHSLILPELIGHDKLPNTE